VDNLEAETRSKARNAWMDNLTGSVASATKARDECKAKMESLQNDLSDLADHMISYFSTEQDLKDIQEHEKAVEDQLKTLDYTQKQKLEGKIAWSQKPEVPYSPSFPKLKIILPVALAIGLLLGVGIAFLREMTDTTVRSDRDVVRVQMQLLGMIGDESQDPQATGARLPLVIFDAPHSMTAEQLRQVRTRLQHAASLDTTRSLLITSPSPGDGKTTIACNLAAGLALNGRRILLVDANFRRPEIHKVFALANEQGFSDVLNGAITFDDVVQETQVPNLAVMTSGPKPINATEMFESQLLIDFIERALEEFDHVIFDSGPMMVVSESSAMASRVDGVVTVVRARGNSRGLLTRMRDTLRAIKAEHLGVVLNGVRAQGGGYYGRNIKTFYEYQNG
jgi:receptor protein-tyrosine kinase